MTSGDIPVKSDDIGPKSTDYASFSGQNRKLSFLTTAVCRVGVGTLATHCRCTAIASLSGVLFHRGDNDTSCSRCSATGLNPQCVFAQCVESFRFLSSQKLATCGSSKWSVGAELQTDGRVLSFRHPQNDGIPLGFPKTSAKKGTQRKVFPDGAKHLQSFELFLYLSLGCPVKTAWFSSSQFFFSRSLTEAFCSQGLDGKLVEQHVRCETSTPSCNLRLTRRTATRGKC